MRARTVTSKAETNSEGLEFPPAASDKTTFRTDFAQNNCTEDYDESVEATWSSINASFVAAAECVPDIVFVLRRPWISEVTVQLISQRSDARAAGDYSVEKRIHKEVRKSAKVDRARWLDEALVSGSWRSVRNLKKPRAAKQGRLKNKSRDIVSSEERADTMAEYLETVQWRVRPATLSNQSGLGEVLPIRITSFSSDEVQKVLRKLHNGKAPGPDGTPAEYWKTLGKRLGAVQPITSSVNLCGHLRRVPDYWR